MTEEQNFENVEAQEQEKVTPAAEPKNTDEHMIPKSRLDEEIQKRRDMEKRLAAIEKANQDAEKKRLEELNDYKTLYERTEGTLAEIKPRAEKVEAYEATLREFLTAELEQIPQDRRSLVPDDMPIESQLRYIARNRSMLVKSKPVEQGAGMRGGGGGEGIPDVELSPGELQTIKDWGYTKEQYLKYKQEKSNE